MTRERLTLFDTTLRDGAQTQGVDFSVERNIAGKPLWFKRQIRASS